MQRRFTVESEIWLCDEIRFNSARNLELYFFTRLGAAFQHFHPLTSLWEHTPRTSQERRRVERFRLSTTGRMPWRTVKLGSFVLIGAWTISLATWLNAVAATFLYFLHTCFLEHEYRCKWNIHLCCLEGIRPCRTFSHWCVWREGGRFWVFSQFHQQTWWMKVWRACWIFFPWLTFYLNVISL